MNFALKLPMVQKYDEKTITGKLVLRKIAKRLGVKHIDEKKGFSPSLLFDWRQNGKDIAENLFEGAYRDVNIALANELAEYCEKIGINFWETRKGANSQPFCHLHYPGTGVGGLCIPVYPRIIIENASKFGKTMSLLEYSRRINDNMPKKCVDNAIKMLLQNKINPKNAKVAVLGLGFRGEVTDTRLSPTYDVVNEFLKKGCTVTVHDPYIFEDRQLPKSVSLTKNIANAIHDVNLIFISSDHKIYSKFNYKLFSKGKKLVLFFDGRNILNKSKIKNAYITTIGIPSDLNQIIHN
jgi:hypothetical protein